MSIIKKENRVLLVVVNLSTGGDPKLQKLYEWLDANALQVARWLLKDQYHRIDTLSGNAVTSTNFLTKIDELAQDPQTEALDVFLSLHGLQNALYFDDGPVTSRSLGDQLGAAGRQDRLRLLYSTACYGANHALDFVSGGFRVASGAKGICANGMYDYPAQLHSWGDGDTYQAAVKAGNNRLGIDISDRVARLLGLNGVNSEKLIAGKKLTRIGSRAV